VLCSPASCYLCLRSSHSPQLCSRTFSLSVPLCSSTLSGSALFWDAFILTSLSSLLLTARHRRRLECSFCFWKWILDCGLYWLCFVTAVTEFKINIFIVINLHTVFILNKQVSLPFSRQAFHLSVTLPTCAILSCYTILSELFAFDFHSKCSRSCDDSSILINALQQKRRRLA
jgi:hypothetical protein